jgi:outer membrane receptor protein involved in Fe transport
MTKGEARMTSPVSVRRTVRRRLLLAASGIAMTIVAGAASAQEAAPAETGTPAPESETVGTDIVVTAQRRSESIGKVPISIASYSRELMDREGVRRIDDISRLTPALRFVPTSGVLSNNSSNIAIRGIASDVGSSTTAIYIDDTPIQIRNIGYFGSGNPYPRIFDLQRVEVLRGPQGTLFGAGAEGGAVRFITPQPDTDALAIYSRAEVSTTENGAANYEYGLAVGGAVSDTLAVRASGWYRRDGGYIDQVTPQTNTVIAEDVNQEATYSAKIALTWRPVDALTITPGIFYQHIESDSRGIFWEGYGDLASGDLKTGVNHLEPSDDTFTLYTLRAEYDFGKVSVVSNTSYFERQQDISFSYLNYFSRLRGGGPFASYASKDPSNSDDLMNTRQRNFTQELRVQSYDNALIDWTIGGYYARTKQNAVQATQSGRTPGVLVGGVPQYQNIYSYYDEASANDRQMAAFASVDIKPLDGLKLTLAARFTRNEFDFRDIRDGPVNGVVRTVVNASQSEEAFTPKISLSYQLDQNNLLYATASKGFRPGGAQPQVSPDFCKADLTTLGLSTSPTSYDSDSLWSYEAGSKNKLFGGLLNLDVNGYHIKWKNIQQVLRLPGCGLSFVSNLGSATGTGAEISVALNPAQGISFGASAGYTRLTYDQNSYGGSGLLLRAEGQRIGGPLWSGSVYGQVERPIGEGTGYIRANYSFATKNIVTATQGTFGYDPGLPALGGTNFVTLRLGMRVSGVDVSLFADNLTNSREIVSRSHDNVGSPLYYDVTYRPRTIGLTGQFRY